MKFEHITIKTNKFEESIKFYTEIVGLNIDSQIEERGIVFMSNKKGETSVEIIKTPDVFEKSGSISIGFEKDGVEDFRNEILGRGYRASGLIRHGDLGFFFIEDPSGLSIQFIGRL